jgi:phage-related minor tail protein
MAGDKKTILDIVKSVEAGEAVENQINPYTGEPSMRRAAINHEKMAAKRMAKDILSQGGTYKGSVYYSNILPQGKGDIPWTKEAANIVEKASQTRAKKSDILAAQNYFAKIGYMHPSEVDGKPGKQFNGMISRWNKNAGQSTDAIFDAMKTWKDRLFDGGAEDFEEDLREGGGDQGGY